MGGRAAVALGGALGTALRVAVLAPVLLRLPPTAPLDLAVAPWRPGALLALDLGGALALGVLVGGAARRTSWRPLVPLLGPGLLGGLTTFSSLAVGIALAARTSPTRATAVAVAALVGGLVAARAGLALGERMGPRPAVGARVVP